MTSRRPLAACLLASALLAAAALALVPIRGDLSALLPRGRTAASRLMLRELQSGAATSLVLAGIEGWLEQQLAALSQGLGRALARDPRFALVENGQGLLDPDQVEALFARRYLLSPAVSAAAFAAPALRADFQRLLAGLQSSASPLVEQYGLPDPTRAFPALIDAWTAGSPVRTAGGVWFAPDTVPGAPPALLLLRLREATPGEGGQAAAVARLRHAFAAPPGRGPARLLLAGPAVFAAEAARSVQADVQRVSVLSVLLVAGLLLWRFRSPWILAAIAIPPLLGVAAGAAAVAARFGFVHGVTLGFGMTMLGVTFDYPVLLVGHRKQAESQRDTLARIGPTFALAALTAAAGLAGMAFAAVPGVAQLGLFALVGLAVAAIATRVLLPPLIVAAGLAPVAFGDPALLRRLEPWRRFRVAAGLVVAAAGLFLLARGGPDWQRSLAGLTPIPAASLALDASLRRDLGAPEPGQIAVIQAASAEDVLRREEALLPALQQLVRDGGASGVELAARLLPSVARQRERVAALPDPATLAARVARAASGLPFAPTAFRRFEAEVAAAPAMAPLRPDALAAAGLDSPVIAARLAALLARRGQAWLGFVAPLGLRNQARFAALFAGLPDAVFVDIPRETDALVAGYLRSTLRLLGAGAILGVLALAATLRDPRRVARVAGAVASALLVTVAALTAGGVKLSLIHLAALPFVAGVGLDYALFFARRQLDEEERARTLRTLLTCIGMTLLTFGLLATCRTPLLRDIGITVAVGVTAAMCCGFLFAGPKAA